jgi:hypothetical protein
MIGRVKFSFDSGIGDTGTVAKVGQLSGELRRARWVAGDDGDTGPLDTGSVVEINVSPDATDTGKGVLVKSYANTVLNIQADGSLEDTGGHFYVGANDVMTVTAKFEGAGGVIGDLWVYSKYER